MHRLSNSVRVVLLRPRTEVAIDELIRVEGASNYSILVFKDGHHLTVAFSLAQLCHCLPELMRIHKRHIVNLAYVSGYVRHRPTELKLTTGEVLPVAKRRKCHVRKLFTQYQDDQP